MSPIENWRKIALGENDSETLRRLGGYVFFVREASGPELLDMARDCTEKAAELGNCDAMLDLGSHFLLGNKVPQSREKAEYWYRLAEKTAGGEVRRWPKIWRCLGNFYLYDNLPDGTVRRTDDEERLKKAHDYFKKGAEADEPNALYALGDMYRSGRFEEKDERLAFEYYERADDEVAYMYDESCLAICLRLGDCLMHGIGTKKDLERARKYLNVALSVGKLRVESGDGYACRDYGEAGRLLAELDEMEKEG